MEIILLSLSAALICGGFAFMVAEAKGYDPTLWFFLGFLFSVVGLMVICGLPLKSENVWVIKKEKEAQEEDDYAHRYSAR